MLKSWLNSSAGERFIAFIISTALRILLKTIRWEIIDQGGKEYIDSGKTVIFISWHCRLFPIPTILAKQYPAAYIISPSKDGRIISQVVKTLGGDTIWGSRSQKALSGYREMRRRLQSGLHVGITPDGPRGPARKAAPGAIALAKASGCALIPISWSTSKIKRFNSWDRLALPLPFSRGVFIYGKPIFTSAQNIPDDIEQACLKLEDATNNVSAEADAIFGHPADHAEARYGIRKAKHDE